MCDQKETISGERTVDTQTLKAGSEHVTCDNKMEGSDRHEKQERVDTHGANKVKSSSSVRTESTDCSKVSAPEKTERCDGVTKQACRSSAHTDVSSRSQDPTDGSLPSNTSERQDHRSGAEDCRVNNNRSDRNSSELSGMFSEPVTFEEARTGLMTALAYLEANHILPGTTFKFLKKRR